VTHLRKMMLGELQRRNYSQTTVRAYLKIVRISPSISTKHQINWGRMRSAPTKSIY
jgi:hypothetical protein